MRADKFSEVLLAVMGVAVLFFLIFTAVMAVLRD
jgi:hypothetical protein